MPSAFPARTFCQEYFQKPGIDFFKKLFYLFIFGCVGSSLLRRLSLVAVSGGYSSLGARASHCGGFSCHRARALGARASVVVARRLQ